ncbi:hypothetical protein EMIHUDRAFT_358531 [Emiliania huxleyi CCMP1516]|uniref:Protein kinase domain-containing protein n=2 Tax=Emiliania huxleyi TaxID=2903 RepID=A0A0D3IDC3_EMIH1|nr:hypothetical protein EMIHUDRAFT_358531 [Emiliania huxleyi CCMP1516]EOD09258.1 hypothetical protein EMIHUDRAFT_358531 [Emiliania huxleyi CCMP1516]|eukprot:XP_005761687.1 hypothetical protein EMIHUDRAFT_358531 [Emiliania huxleyi CCMP1516]
MLLGRYRLGRELGRGAYGVVNEARDFRDGRRSIAIKSLDLSVLPRSETAWTADAIEQEVALMRRLDHPNVVRVFDLVRASGSDRLFIIMELCRGPDLQLVLAKRGATELCEAAAVLRQCVDALLHLHSRGIVHRDVKPSNICFATPISDLLRSSLREEQVKLIDFGLARLLPFPCISPPALSRSPPSLRIRGSLWPANRTRRAVASC